MRTPLEGEDGRNYKEDCGGNMFIYLSIGFLSDT
jgi:hypothetical protein